MVPGQPGNGGVRGQALDERRVVGIERQFVERLDAFGRGKGGYWEDRGYQWYAGI